MDKFEEVFEAYSPKNPRYRIIYEKTSFKIFFEKKHQKNLDKRISSFKNFLNKLKTKDIIVEIEHMYTFIKCIEDIEYLDAINLKAIKGKIPVLEYLWLDKIKKGIA